MRPRRQLIRDFHAGQYLDLFLLSGVVAVLGIRFFLRLTGYPKVGGEALHVAHMLWGGLLMLVAIFVLLSFLGRRGHQLAAVLGGAGFGTFIDEVGKFVTHDNDYFFQPAVALIYVTFVLTYLAVRSVHRERTATPDEYLANALQEMENVAFRDLDEVERDRALRYLERSDPADPLVATLRDLFHRTDLVPVPDPHPVVRLRAAALRLYRRLATHPGFARAVIVFFVVQLLFKAGQVAAVVFWTGPEDFWLNPLAPFSHPAGEFSFTQWAQIGSSLLAGVFVLLGVLRFRRSRVGAYRMFQRSILVSILLTQVFMFYHEQWAALTTLAFNLLVLGALNFAIGHEAERDG